MRNRLKNNLLLACMFAMSVLTGCYDTDDTISVRREIIDVGQVNVGDTVNGSFTFKNNKKEEIAIAFLPECDCTLINTDMIRLKPRECGKLEVRVAVENPGEFIKYVYVQAAGKEDFLAVAIKGRTK